MHRLGQVDAEKGRQIGQHLAVGVGRNDVPWASSESLMAWAFSMIPLCTSAIRPAGRCAGGR